MASNGLMIQYEWCTGCHACEVACKQEHNFKDGMVGIRVEEITSKSPEKVYVDFFPILTRFCDLCAERTKSGDMPSCVKHCQSRCMSFGTIEQLGKAQKTTPKSVVYAPK
jgi:Fe-S-cluster-containing dehydrogenase component